MTPRELTTLAELRGRRQAPELAVFVLDDWRWAERIGDDLGALAIKVRNGRDVDHDWSPLAGLWVILSLRNADDADWSTFGSRLLAANPWRLSLFRDGHLMKIWEQK
jgi:hypothetical protein